MRRRYIGGRNFDAVMGVDLLQRDEEDELYRYLREECPFVLVMALNALTRLRCLLDMAGYVPEQRYFRWMEGAIF